MIQFIAGAAIGGLVIGALTGSLLMGKYKDARWSAATNELKVQAAESLQVAEQSAIKIERTAQVRVRELESEHETTTDTLEALERSNRDLVTKLGGMRDPGRRPSRPNTVPAVAIQTPRLECPADSGAGILSAEFTEDLIKAAALADANTEYAWQGYQWADEVEKVMTPKEPD